MLDYFQYRTKHDIEILLFRDMPFCFDGIINLTPVTLVFVREKIYILHYRSYTMSHISTGCYILTFLEQTWHKSLIAFRLEYSDSNTHVCICNYSIRLGNGGL